MEGWSANQVGPRTPSRRFACHRDTLSRVISCSIEMIGQWQKRRRQQKKIPRNVDKSTRGVPGGVQKDHRHHDDDDDHHNPRHYRHLKMVLAVARFALRTDLRSNG